MFQSTKVNEIVAADAGFTLLLLMSLTYGGRQRVLFQIVFLLLIVSSVLYSI